MVQRLALVPLAAVGFATAVLVGGAGGAVTSVVRIQPPGVEPNGPVTSLAMTDDGSCIVGETTATNDVAADGNGSGSDIVLFERASGTWTRITNGDAGSFDPSISDDCNLVVFATNATDLVAPDTNGFTDVVVFDRTASAFTRVTVNAGSPEVSGDGAFVVVRDLFSDRPLRLPIEGGSPVQIAWGPDGPANDQVTQFSVSDDGNLVVFMTHADNLLGTGVDTNGRADVFLRNVSAETTSLVSEATGGGLATGGAAGSILPEISGNGRYVAFESDMPGITGGAFGPVAIVRDLSTSTNVPLAGNNGVLDVNDSGTVALVTEGSGDTADADSDPDVYVVNGFTSSVEWVSQAPGGGPGTGGTFPFVGSPLLSEDGTVVAFTSTRTSFVDRDANGVEDGFVVLLGTGGGGSTSGSTSTSTSTTTTSTATTTTTSTASTTTTPTAATTTTAAATTASTPTTTTTTTTTTAASGTPPAAAPFVDLVVTKTASAAASGGSFAPGERVEFTVEIENRGTADAQFVYLEDSVHANRANGTLTGRLVVGVPFGSLCSEHEIGGFGLDPGHLVKCSVGAIAAGSRKTVRYDATVLGGKARSLTNSAQAYEASGRKDADPTNNYAKVSVAFDGGARECTTASMCSSPPGTTTTTCAGENTVCTYGGEGVMNTVCTGESACGGGPLAETHVCTGGATCTDRLGEPNLFRCSGRDTYCAGTGTFVCTDGAFCRVWGEGTTVTCSGGAELDLRGIGNRARLNGCDAEIGSKTRSVTGGAGDDVVVVKGGNPSVATGGGNDTVLVRDGTSTVRTGAGDDVVDVRNGDRNVVDTGAGHDSVQRDGGDVVSRAEVDPRMDLAIVAYESTASPLPTVALSNGAVDLVYELYEQGSNPEARIVVVNRGPASTPAYLIWELGVERAERIGIEGLSVREADAEGGSCRTRTGTKAIRVTCTLGVLATGERRSVLIRFTSSRGGYWGRHGAIVTDRAEPPCSEETDRDCVNNWKRGARFAFFTGGVSLEPSHRVFEVPGGPDTSVAVFGPERIRSEAFARYVVVVRNIGVITANDVTAEIDLAPLGRRVPNAAVTLRAPDGGTCRLVARSGWPKRPVNATSFVECSLPPIAVGERKRIEIEINGEELRSRRWRGYASTAHGPVGFFAWLGLAARDKSGLGTLRTGQFSLRAEGRAADEYKLRENRKVFFTLIDP